MIKIYNVGVNVCIEDYSPELPLYFIPTHQTRLDVEDDKVIITDTFSNKIDRFVVKLDELEDNNGNLYATKATAIAYLSEFIGKSYCCSSESSTDEPLNQTFAYNDLAVGREVVIDYKTLANVDVKRQTITYDGNDNIVSNIYILPPYAVS